SALHAFTTVSLVSRLSRLRGNSTTTTYVGGPVHVNHILCALLALAETQGRAEAPDPSDSRRRRAAATMWARACVTSGHPRVFKPQSGLIQSRSMGIRSAVRRTRCTISSTGGTLGEWIS